MRPQLKYRQGSIDDKPGLMAVGQLAFAQFQELLRAEHWVSMNRFLQNEKMWDQLISTSSIFVCVAGLEIVGSAFLVPGGHPTHIYPVDWAYIRMVAVHPSYRGRGIARRLTQDCVNLARETGEKIVGLHTSEKMEVAQHVYESIGFRRDREIDPIYGMRYWVYKLELTS
jgi:ribosomal protein S18 acetylase RimI-like enzyme